MRGNQFFNGIVWQTQLRPYFAQGRLAGVFQTNPDKAVLQGIVYRQVMNIQSLCWLARLIAIRGHHNVLCIRGDRSYFLHAVSLQTKPIFLFDNSTRLPPRCDRSDLQGTT